MRRLQRYIANSNYIPKTFGLLFTNNECNVFPPPIHKMCVIEVNEGYIYISYACQLYGWCTQFEREIAEDTDVHVHEFCVFSEYCDNATTWRRRRWRYTYSRTHKTRRGRTLERNTEESEGTLEEIRAHFQV